jgi:Spy/CpxP family protein refolding chaperone
VKGAPEDLRARRRRETMKRSNILTAGMVALLVAGLVAAPAAARWGDPGEHGGHGRAGCGQRMGHHFGPEFTSEQMESIEKIHEKYRDAQVELRNSLKASALELREIFESGDPDFGAVERKLEEMADVRLELMKTRIQIHKEVRPLLSEDQQVLFDKKFARAIGRIGGAGCHGHGSGDGPMGPCPMRGQRPGMRGMRMGDGGGEGFPWAEDIGAEG